MSFVIHWDDVPARRRRAGSIDARWRDLGRAAGSVGAGVRRIEIRAGARSTPAHSHGSAEELFYVLGGSGLSWQDGRTHEVGPGDCLLHRAGGPAHTLLAGDAGLDVLAFGPRSRTDATRLPRAGVFWLGAWWTADPGPPGPFEREPEDLPHEPGERPPTTIHRGAARVDVTRRTRARFASFELGEAVGSVSTGMSEVTIEPGFEGFPPHCHAAEEEIFVVLGGSGVAAIGDEEHNVRRGSVVARPPGTRVAHCFRAGDEPLTYLAWGTREPNDIAYFPRSRKVNLRGVGVIGRIEPAEYWDGEE